MSSQHGCSRQSNALRMNNERLQRKYDHLQRSYEYMSRRCTILESILLTSAKLVVPRQPRNCWGNRVNGYLSAASIRLAHHHEIIGKTSRRRTKQVQKCSKYLKFHVRLLYFWLPFSDFSFYLGSCEELWDITGFIINYEYMRRWWPDFLIRHVGDGDHEFWFRKVVCWMFACCLVYVTSLRTWQYGSFEVTSCAGY